MRKTITVSSVILYVSMLLTVNAQTTFPSNANPQNASNFFGQVVAIIGVVAIFGFIAYAGYKVIRKWSSGKSE